MMKTRLATVTLMLTVAACSTNPDRIAATEAVGRPFIDASCDALVAERERTVALLEEAVNQQKSRINGEVVGAVAFGIVGVAASRQMTGGDQEASIGTYRGALQAIADEGRVKGCENPVLYEPDPTLTE